MKIYSPVLNFNGIRWNVRFVKGVGESDDPQVIEWFRSRGYEIEPSNCVEKDVTLKVGDVTFDLEPKVDDRDYSEFEKMTPIELREWMKNNGMGSLIKNIRNKEKLIALIREAWNGN